MRLRSWFTKHGASAVSLMEIKANSVLQQHRISAMDTGLHLPAHPQNWALSAVPAVIVVHNRHARWLAFTIAGLVGHITR